MGNPVTNAACSLAYASAYDNEPAANYYPIHEAANIEVVPRRVERIANATPDPTHSTVAGVDCSWMVNGITPHAELAGFLLYAMFGGDSFSVDTHTITPAASLPFVGVLIDRMADIDASDNHVQRLNGGKLDALEIIAERDQFIKFSAKGLGCAPGTNVASLSQSIPSGDDNEPLAWKHQQGSGYFKIDDNGGGLVADDTIQSWKLSMSRAALLGGYLISTGQPSQHSHGVRAVTLEIVKEFYGSTAEAEAENFFALSEYLGIEIYLEIGSTPYTFKITIPKLTWTANPFGETGVKDEMYKVTYQLKAEKTAAALITGLVLDGTSAAYNA